MDNKNAVSISREKFILIGLFIFFVILALFANLINSKRLSNNSRASGTNQLSYNNRVQEITELCTSIKGYLARTEMAEGLILFDRFSGRYYSLDKKNPAVTPLPAQPDTAYCGSNGVFEKNWCESIISESACRADCVWIQTETCGKCAPLGVDPGIICSQ
jgi:hypothetical protein